MYSKEPTHAFTYNLSFETHVVVYTYIWNLLEVLSLTSSILIATGRIKQYHTYV